MITIARSHKRLLLVDDDFSSREVLSMLLAGEGYRVAAAANGADALQRLHDPDCPNLILLDLNMPVMDGPTFCEHRRQEESLAAIPVIVLSAAADAEQKAAALGAVRCLRKPVDTIELLRIVREHLS